MRRSIAETGQAIISIRAYAKHNLEPRYAQLKVLDDGLLQGLSLAVSLGSDFLSDQPYCCQCQQTNREGAHHLAQSLKLCTLHAMHLSECDAHC